MVKNLVDEANSVDGADPRKPRVYGETCGLEIDTWTP